MYSLTELNGHSTTHKMTRAVLINVSEGSRKTPRVLSYSTAATVKAEFIKWIRQLSKAQRAGRPKRRCSLKSPKRWGEGSENSTGLTEDPVPVRLRFQGRLQQWLLRLARSSTRCMRPGAGTTSLLPIHIYHASNSNFCTDVSMAKNMYDF